MYQVIDDLRDKPAGADNGAWAAAPELARVAWNNVESCWVLLRSLSRPLSNCEALEMFIDSFQVELGRSYPERDTVTASPASRHGAKGISR